MRYLITGITGFAGPHLAKHLLHQGHEIYGLIRASNGRETDLLDVLAPDELEAIRFIYADLTDYASLWNHGDMGWRCLDGIFHLAAQSHPPTSFAYPVKTFADNVTGTVNLLDVVQRLTDCPVMVCSTSEVYGNAGRDGVLTEDTPLQPCNPYGVSKASVDLYMQERCATGANRGFITRAFSHTGPRRGKKFSISWDAYNLALMASGKLASRELPVGNLDTKRVVIDVRDTVRAYAMLMAKHEDGVAYNICGPANAVREMRYFTDALIDISGLGDAVTTRVSDELWRPVDIEVQIGSTAKLVAQTGWTPDIPIKQTLTDLYDYWRRKLG